MKNVFAVLFFSLMLAACTAVPGARVGTPQQTIIGTRWQLLENIKGKTPTLVIEEGKVSGNAGCNSYFGGVTVDASTGNFAVSNVGSTRMMCENIGVETGFLNSLQQANKYILNGNNLELYRDRLLLLKFTKLP